MRPYPEEVLKAIQTGIASHFVPPTAPSSTAWLLRARSITSSRSGVPWASIDAPPIRCSSKCSEMPCAGATASRTRRASRVTSGERKAILVETIDGTPAPLHPLAA